jgi:hypothetical protein
MCRARLAACRAEALDHFASSDDTLLQAIERAVVRSHASAETSAASAGSGATSDSNPSAIETRPIALALLTDIFHLWRLRLSASRHHSVLVPFAGASSEAVLLRVADLVLTSFTELKPELFTQNMVCFCCSNNNSTLSLCL